MKHLKLPPRLMTAVGFIPDSGSFADVGTDHGLVPAYLALTGHAGEITAADIAPAPLESARRTARQFGVESAVRFVMTDGLQGLPLQESVLIAGMGGENIAGILERCRWSLEHTRLILQPQSRLPELRIWLWEHGFDVTGARLCRDTGRMYVVLKAEYGDAGRKPTPAEQYADRRLLTASDELLGDWLDWHAGRLKTALEALEASGRGDSGQAAYFKDAIAGLESMIGMNKEDRHGDCTADI